MSGETDAFDRIKSEAQSALASQQFAKDLAGDCVAPVPPGAPDLPASWKALGVPSRVWTYRDGEGRPLRHTLRFPKAAPGEEGRPPETWTDKDIRPCTLWKDGQPSHLRWKLKAEPGLRPLYGIDRLTARPDADVLVCEGEKDADGAGDRLSAYVAIAWPGGSNAVKKADFSPLAGRRVFIWPDADEPGRNAAAAVRQAALAAGAISAVVVALPTALPKGWGLADPWPPGFGADEARRALDEATAGAEADQAADAVEWPWGFRMEPDGLFFDQPTKDGATVPSRLSGPFEVVGEARDPTGGGWSVVLRFRDRDQREKTAIVARSRLASGAAEVRSELADAGLMVSPARGKADKFAIALSEVRSGRRIILVSATGWCGDRFVLPKLVVGQTTNETVLFTGEAPSLHYGQSGSLSSWQRDVASKAEGNILLTFALSLAFLGPLLRPLELEGGGVHFRGSSSCGKTTLAYVAGSVWGGGGPLGFGQTWRATANALEMVAYGHNDGLAVFDELALVAPEEAGAAAYSLASGQSKARSRADGSLRRRPEWRIAILSTGEIGLADHIRAGRKGERPMAGQELRLLDVAADAGAHMGVWETLHGAAGPAEFSDEIKAAAARHYGQAGPAFLERFLSDRSASVRQASAILQGFLAQAARPSDTGQAYRAALRFGAIAAAGELAAAFGVTPWPAGVAAAAALKLYHRWADAFGRDAPREEQEILRRLRGVIQSERSAFSPLGDDDTTDEALPSAGGRDGEARGLKTYGYRHVCGPNVRYLFHDEGWGHVFRGFNATEAARVVDRAGFLETDGGERRLKKATKIRGERLRLYSVRSSILEADLGD